MKSKYLITDARYRAKYGDYFYTTESDRACRQSGPRARCMTWHKKYFVSQKPCRSPATCGCRTDTPERQAWRAATNLCNNVST